MKLSPVFALLLVCILQQTRAGSFSSRRLLQEDRAVLASVQALNRIDECTNTYLGLKLISDQTSQSLTVLENGAIANNLDLKNLTELIAINSATLVRSSVNISELQMTVFTLTQDLLAFNSDLLGLENDVLQSQAQLDALSNIVTVNGTGLILPVIGSVISPNDTLTAIAECPSGYRPLKIGCSIDGPDITAFFEEGTTTALTGPIATSIIRQTVEGSTGTCSYQLYYITSGAQVNVEFNTAAVPPVTATAQVLCRAINKLYANINEFKEIMRAIMRPALAILLVLCAAGTLAQESPVNEDDRLGILGKENSKELIQNVLNLKYQIGNNTARIKALNVSIQANAATDVILQAQADANAATIEHQASLVTDIEDAVTNLIEVLQNNFTLPFALQLVETVGSQLEQINTITANLNSLGRRRLLQATDEANVEDRLLAPITIETAKKCDAELIKLGAAVLKNNQSVYELRANYDINEVDIAILEATVAQNQANITALVSRIEALRSDLEQRQSILAGGTILTTVVQNITGLGATEAINGLLDVTSTQNIFPVESGSVLPNLNVDATCPIGDLLIGGSCEIIIPDGVTLADLAPYITNGAGTQKFASLSFPLTEDYTNNLVSCAASVVATDGTTTDTNATWEAAPFTLQYRAEALCYNSQGNVTTNPFSLSALAFLGF